MKTKKLIAMVLTLVLAAAMFAGCGSETEQPAEEKPVAENVPAEPEENKDPLATTGEDVTIEFYSGYTGADGNVVAEFVEQYGKDHPNVHINVTTLQFTSLFSKFMTDAAAGNIPDILMVHPQEQNAFVRLGLVDTEAVARAGLKEEDYLPGPWKNSFINGVQVGIPVDVGGLMLFANDDMLAEAGIDEIPTDGEGFIACMQKLTLDAKGNTADSPDFDPENIVQYGMGFPSTNHFAFYYWYSLIRQQGEELTSDDGLSVAFSTEAGVKAAQLMQDFIYKYHICPAGQSASFDDFYAKQTATCVAGNWYIPQLNSAAPDFAVSSHVLPTFYDEDYYWGSGSHFVFPKTADGDINRQNEAIKFIKALSEWEGYPETGHIPAYKANAESARDLPYREALFEMMGEHQATLPDLPKSIQAYSATAPSAILSLGSDVLLNQADCASAVETFQKAFGAILTQP
ncbi:MAG: extracellular solute-binding protein [Candidatus Limivicinus sp.]|jgi:multiple sugar transport system substrate-binding protein